MDPETIRALTTGMIAVIGAIATASVLIIRAIRDTNKAVKRVEILVDGRYSKVLEKYGEVSQKLADVLLTVSRQSGLSGDKALAEAAQKTATEAHGIANEQAERLRQAEQDKEANELD